MSYHFDSFKEFVTSFLSTEISGKQKVENRSINIQNNAKPAPFNQFLFGNVFFLNAIIK